MGALVGRFMNVEGRKKKFILSAAGVDICGAFFYISLYWIDDSTIFIMLSIIARLLQGLVIYFLIIYYYLFIDLF